MDCSLCDTLRHVTNICRFFESAVCSAEDLAAYQRHKVTGDTEPVKGTKFIYIYIYKNCANLTLNMRKKLLVLKSFVKYLK